LFFALTGLFLSPFSMFQDPCMTAKSHIGGGCMISSVPWTMRLVGSALLILLLERWTDPSSSSRCRIV
jgi:hypothetical protein